MMYSRLSVRSVVVFTSLLLAGAGAQVTLTGCHIHEGREVCLLPGGAETTIAASTIPSPSPTAPTSNVASTTGTAQTTAITDCHNHGTTQFCVKGNGEEVQVLATQTGTAALPTAYTGCHAHGTETFCMTPDGKEVEVVGAAGEDSHGSGSTSESSEEESGECHFHAGVEHCPGQEQTCERKDRDYNVPLRIGLLFVILFTSAIGVYAPILIRKLLHVDASGVVFSAIKQFGTGIIVATALIHLLTHAQLMFGNECLQGLKYEATTTAVAMAGAFIAFALDFTGHRLASWRRAKVLAATNNNNTNSASPSIEGSPNPKVETGSTQQAGNLASLSHHHDNLGTMHPNDTLSVLILEAGIIFHSLLLGITLVVAGDSVFITLFIVIVFHQMFEGLALGARIAALEGLRKTKYIIMPMAFALVTPTGMAIGIGVLGKFNGNDPSTLIALGTLDAVSAGILLWVGLVSMWAHDWMFGELRDAPLGKTLIAGVFLVAGMALMGLLGKWA